jgi:hypothetical protein
MLSTVHIDNDVVATEKITSFLFFLKDSWRMQTHFRFQQLLDYHKILLVQCLVLSWNKNRDKILLSHLERSICIKPPHQLDRSWPLLCGHRETESNADRGFRNLRFRSKIFKVIFRLSCVAMGIIRCDMWNVSGDDLEGIVIIKSRILFVILVRRKAGSLKRKINSKENGKWNKRRCDYLLRTAW